MFSDAGYEVLSAVVTESTIFWDIMLYIPLKVNPRFGGTAASIFRAEE
jgi:hypothetical protein